MIDVIYKIVAKAITFEKIEIVPNGNKTNVPSHLHIFWLNFDIANHSFLPPVLPGETDFQKILPGVLSVGLEIKKKILDLMIFWECEHHKLKDISHTY